jgi:hypothetical protein
MPGPILQIQLPEGLTPEMLAKCAQHYLNAVARMNADWVLEEWEAGRDPKCCAKCNGTRYVPGGIGSVLTALPSPVLFKKGYGSCGSIAACHTGHKIAEAVKGRLDPKYKISEPIAWDEACERFQVRFKKAKLDPAAPYLHAICDDNGMIIDATEGMRR